MAETPSNGKENATKANPRRKGRAFHRPGAAARKRVVKAAADKGFAEPDVLLRWAEAVGPHLAKLSEPIKVSYGGSIGASLLVRVTPGRAPEVMHQEPQILERINSFYGYKAISRLRLTQATGLSGQPGFAEHSAAFEGPGAKPRLQTPKAAAVEKAKTLGQRYQKPRPARCFDNFGRMGAVERP